MKKRIHAYYSGQVQGVGFRFTAERLAVDLGLSGWVRNLSDNRVELLCEGKEEDLHEILAKIDKRLSGYIRQKKMLIGCRPPVNSPLLK